MIRNIENLRNDEYKAIEILYKDGCMYDDAHVKRILSTVLFNFLQYIQIHMALLCLNMTEIVYLHVYLHNKT